MSSGSQRRHRGSTIPFVDTHVHFWDHELPGFSWAWLDPSFQQFGETYRLDAPRFTTPEFRRESEGADVGGMVHVNATAPLADPSAETAWLDEMAEQHGWPNAIIGACKMNDPEAPMVLRRHARWARLKGVRDLTFAQHSAIEDIGAAFDTVADLGLCVEVRTPVPQLGAIAEVARRWPSVNILLGHAGLPPQRNEETLTEWRAAVGRIAGEPNVFCKISAVGGNSDRNWTVESIRPWIMGCIEAFGPNRCMFGTNWPLDRLWRSYGELVAAYREVIVDLDVRSQHQVLHGTAEQVLGFSL